VSVECALEGASTGEPQKRNDLRLSSRPCGEDAARGNGTPTHLRGLQTFVLQAVSSVTEQ